MGKSAICLLVRMGKNDEIEGWIVGDEITITWLYGLLHHEWLEGSN